MSAAPDGNMDAVLAGFASLPRVSAEEERRGMLSASIYPRLKAYGWEPRFFTERTGDWGCPEQLRKFDRCRELFTGCGAIVALVGPRGVGKTTIGFQLALKRALSCWLRYLSPEPDAPRGLTWQLTPYVKLTDLLGRFKALYSDFGTTDPERLMAAREGFCKNNALAVIDEIHECAELRAAPRLLTDIIDRRYAARRDTLLITNQTAEEFATSIGDSIYSRLTEHGAILRCEWESWREKA